MQILISPAKTMTGNSPIKAPYGTTPRFEKNAIEIALQMAQFTPEELRRMFKLSPQLALETYRRFQDFHTEEIPKLQALQAYTGVVFKHIRPYDFTNDDFEFAQTHLRIASFCYGLLKPLDRIKPYRMEPDIKLPELTDGNMYNYWRPRQTQTLLEDVKNDDHTLIYLASMDIQPAFDWKKIKQYLRIVTPEFKIWKNGKMKTIVIYAKMARGEMTRYIIKNRIRNPEELKTFSWEGFQYHESLSNEDSWIFLQE